MSNESGKPVLINEGKNPVPISQSDIPQNRTGHNAPPVGEHPKNPVITPAPPPKKKE